MSHGQGRQQVTPPRLAGTPPATDVRQSQGPGHRPKLGTISDSLLLLSSLAGGSWGNAIGDGRPMMSSMSTTAAAAARRVMSSLKILAHAVIQAETRAAALITMLMLLMVWRGSQGTGGP